MIDVKNLTKIYGDHVALSDLSFTVENGKIYGLLGPNGAGKSTTMNIITGCLAATTGQVTINGYDIFEDAEKAKKFIGYLPELPPLYQDMTPKEYLTFVAKAKGVEKSEIGKQLEEIIEVTQINSVAHRLIKNLSKGYKQRVGIAQALIGHPEIIILDEPTVGLDPKQIIEIRDLIITLGKSHTVILSSHILSEVSAVCDSIMIISGGKLVASDTPENLEKLFAGTSTIELKTKATEDEVNNALSSIDKIKEISYNISEKDNIASVLITCDGNEDLSEEVFIAFCGINRPILRMNMAQISLEDIFLQLTSDSESHSIQVKDNITESENLNVFDDEEEIQE